MPIDLKCMSHSVSAANLALARSLTWVLPILWLLTHR